MMRLPAIALLTMMPATAIAADPPLASTGSLLQVLFGLIVVLALMAGAAWLMRRMGVAGTGSNSVAKIVGGVSVGNRERILVVEVADQWIVVGVTATSISALSTMPRQEITQPPHIATESPNFASWLKQSIDKRNSR